MGCYTAGVGLLVVGVAPEIQPSDDYGTTAERLWKTVTCPSCGAYVAPEATCSACGKPLPKLANLGKTFGWKTDRPG